jgi:hypothetical protein
MTSPAQRSNLLNDADQRRTLLQETALLVGQRWFDSWQRDLAGQGRAVEGGWPGTVPEARALVAAQLVVTLAGESMSPATREEIAWAARATYDTARRAWLGSPARRKGPEA